ncbi:MAG: anti-sigma factor [Candidatus Latescibacterota bacterium]|nr:MAG: anti-sigma factor [Candidatus Latescibacterota bacterium]
MSPDLDRLQELLADRSTQGLSADEQQELDALLSDSPAHADDFDLAAAALHLAVAEPELQMPTQVRRRLRERADAYTRSAATVQPEPVRSAASRRAELLATAPDAVALAWSATQDAAAAGARGDVVWSASRQEGYMRFNGLAANDPAVSQYQLWVFDRERDESYPVDGGVFDIPAGAAEVVVAIETRVPVAAATLFAVTVEPPGGVVVSSRERIALVAQPAGD